MVRIGAFKAKTHLSKLLNQVEGGETIVITRHGKDIARLVPAVDSGHKTDPARLVASWKQSRRGVKLGGTSIKALINQGRKH
jgi:prevent-host-death family protein